MSAQLAAGQPAAYPGSLQEMTVPDIKMAIIDGTGDWSDADYVKSMKFSFCRQLAEQLGANAHYKRGPSFDGMSDASKMWNAHDWLKAQHDGDPAARLMLAGYSRGGSVAIAAAQKLQDDGVAVDALFLFDAVARDVLMFGRVIPGNVRFCRLARRSQDAAFVDKYEKKYAVGFGVTVTNPFSSNVTRPSFGGVGTTVESGVDYVSATFKGSHGALGGVGWPNVPEDVPCQEAVAAWMNGWLHQQSVPVALKSTPPS